MRTEGFEAQLLCITAAPMEAEAAQAHPCSIHTLDLHHQPPIPQPLTVPEPAPDAHLHMRAGSLPGPAFGSQKLIEKVF